MADKKKKAKIERASGRTSATSRGIAKFNKEARRLRSARNERERAEVAFEDFARLRGRDDLVADQAKQDFRTSQTLDSVGRLLAARVLGSQRNEVRKPRRKRR